MKKSGYLAICALLALASASCSNSASSSNGDTCGTNAAGYAPSIVPADFSTTIDNRYLPLVPGTIAKFTNADGEVVEQQVLTDTKLVMGVETVVVHDFQKDTSGNILEDTYDYYAQDDEGNVWYFGEDTKAYVGTQVSTAGSWLGGVNCAYPGIVMKADPQVGEKYYQEYLPNEAEDEAEIVSLSETATVPFGTFDNCVMTKETTRLAPGDEENKYYCPGVGFGPILVKDIGTIDTGKHEDLVSINGATSCEQNPAGYNPTIIPADFSTTIDNEYLSYPLGSVFKYEDLDGNAIQQEVTTDTKLILGVTTVVVHDFMKDSSGTLLEDTYDYYAQDKDGNVWYFGEDTKAYVGTRVSTAGSWVAGVGCAQPGIVMKGTNAIGDKYRQEYRQNEAEDEAETVSLTETVTVSYGTFHDCLETKETTRLVSGDIANKYYCPGVPGGAVLTLDIGTVDAGSREELVSVDGRTSP